MPTIEDVLAHGYIPTMGGFHASFPLYNLASNLTGEGCVVECGSWVGSSLIPIIWGLKDAGLSVPVHCFDIFKSTAEQIPKAAVYGVTLKDGQDLLPMTLANIPRYDEFFAHRGWARDMDWVGRKVELYVDDCNKQRQHFVPVMRKFSPYFIPGKTTLVLMDYHFDESARWKTDEQREVYRAQKNFVKDHPASFQSIGRLRTTTIQIFRFTAPIEFTEEELAVK